MAKRGFTLLELMVVVAIMAALATLSVGGYRALTKGMQDRSAIVAVQTLVDAARQRADIDRRPVVVYFYDELLQKADEYGADLVGRGVAVAVRPTGRISAVDGQTLYDEFNDLDRSYSLESTSSGGGSMRIYKLADGSYADVETSVVEGDVPATYVLTGETVETVGDASSSAGGEKLIKMFGFKKTGGGASFLAGDAYGGEFMSVTLPKGYYFGSSAPTSVERVRVGEPMEIKPSDTGASSGARAVTVYAMKAGSTQLDPVGSTKTGGN